jgi:hypothetical protein
MVAKARNRRRLWSPMVTWGEIVCAYGIYGGLQAKSPAPMVTWGEIVCAYGI